MNDLTEADPIEMKKELSKPMKNLIHLLARIAVNQYIEDIQNTEIEKSA